VLKSLKGGLPYLLRFETVEAKPHPDHIAAKVTVPNDGMPANELLKLVAKRLPHWQATAFPGHLILYKERRPYKHGTVIWPLS
jgi:hypothetical protein